MRHGFRWLRFEPGLEAIYRLEQFREGLRYLRFNLLILAAIIFAIVQIDQVVLPAVSAIVPDLARVGIMVPLLGLGFGLTYLRGADVWYPRVMATLMALALVAIAWIGLSAWEQGESRVFVRLVIATMVVFFVLGLPFRLAFVANLTAVVFYAAAAAAKAMPAPELTHYLAMLLMTNVICAAGAYHLEHARRSAWLEGQLLAQAAMIDGLTGIANRRRFDEHLGRAWHQGVRENLPVSLLFADIDHFKSYNDRYGHQAGDEALRAVAGILSRTARRPFDLAARYGGEEFGVVLFGTPAKQAHRIGEAVLESVRRLGIRHSGAGTAGLLTASMGVATVMPTARRSFGGLVQLADQALYAAKDRGRNRVEQLEQEYEHMKSGFFRRDAGEGGGPAGAQ